MNNYLITAGLVIVMTLSTIAWGAKLASFFLTRSCAYSGRLELFTTQPTRDGYSGYSYTAGGLLVVSQENIEGAYLCIR